MKPLSHSPIEWALRNVSSLKERNRLDCGIDAPGVTAGHIARVGIIGAGVMGSGIAAVNLRSGRSVVISDASADALQRCGPAILAQAVADASDGDVMASLDLATSDAQIAGCDLVIESIVENPEVKQKVLARLEPQLAPGTILATNTSTIPITQIAVDLQRPQSFCGIHFCNPVRHRKLVEVVRGERTDDATVATAVAYAKQLGKMPIVVRDTPGFLVNRLLCFYLTEAAELLCEGADIEDIERVAREFGMLMGPLEMYDMIGTDTSFYAGRTMFEAFRDRIIASPVLPAMIKSGRMGQKNGRGFYSYATSPPVLDRSVLDLLAVYFRDKKEFTDEQLASRLFLPMLLEATRTLEEHIVRDARDVDLGSIFGLGFPATKGGLLFWADSLGADTIVEMLEPLRGLGLRAQPTKLLQRMAESGATFY